MAGPNSPPFGSAGASHQTTAAVVELRRTTPEQTLSLLPDAGPLIGKDARSVQLDSTMFVRRVWFDALTMYETHTDSPVVAWTPIASIAAAGSALVRVFTIAAAVLTRRIFSAFAVV